LNEYGLFTFQFVTPSQDKSLEKFMTRLFKEKTHADIIFKVENQEFPANKCVLSLRCPYFEKMFSSNMIEARSSSITINNVRPQVFQAMLQHLYFAKFELGSDIAEELFMLSHEYLLDELKDQCEKVLMQNINMEIVPKMILFAEQYDARNLRRACLTFAKIHNIFGTQNINQIDKDTLLELQKLKLV